MPARLTIPLKLAENVDTKFKSDCKIIPVGTPIARRTRASRAASGKITQ